MSEPLSETKVTVGLGDRAYIGMQPPRRGGLFPPQALPKLVGRDHEGQAHGQQDIKHRPLARKLKG